MKQIPMSRRPITHIAACAFLVMVTLPIASCTPTSLALVTAPSVNFGPNGQLLDRAIQVGFVNNTPFRAIFTFGSYHPLDKDTVPTAFGQQRLEGNTASAQVAQPCRSTFSVGGNELIRLINLNQNDPAINIADPRALIRGVNFSAAPLGDPLEAEPTEGTAQGISLVNGFDYTCVRPDIRQPTGTGLLVFTFEQDAMAPGGFRIDFQFFDQ